MDGWLDEWMSGVVLLSNEWVGDCAQTKPFEECSNGEERNKSEECARELLL
jgi:hypothetical protein